MQAYVETWKGIALTVGRSERWCRYMAQRLADPLPVFKVGGIVRLNTADYQSWVLRQRTADKHKLPPGRANERKSMQQLVA